ncbi:hypothetical protein INT48_002346 [Thamnidium elegans]|uniref:F-box domain-containing protein n=1 Tax=Thamnidium elegans TaxID=101142 RepID=A0A8H7SWH2_9FUNG|nr:hypothetical protein INT48_002346 [Thamnidium elegans]
MSHLPFEILRPIFDDLKEKEDVLQCQRTCKQWYKASVLYLYTTVILQSEKQTQQYARTILKSPQLASCLRVIDTEKLLTKVKYRGENILPTHVYSANDEYFGDFYNWDDTRFSDMYGAEYRSSNKINNKEYLLDTIIRQCPNVIRIKMKEPPTVFWQKLSEAAIQEQLLHLSKLPAPTDCNMEFYIKTALYFKNSLQSLYIYEEGFYLNAGVSKETVFMVLRRRISEFIRLKRIDIFFLPYRRLNNLDGLIEDCPHLEKINIRMRFEDININRFDEVEPTTLINARPDIRVFKSENTITATNMNQLKYMMQKFTNLQRLVIILALYEAIDHHDSVTKLSVLAQFFGYLMLIPVCKVKMIINRAMFIEAWNEFTSKTDQSKELIMKYATTFGDNDELTVVEIEQDFIKVSYIVTKRCNVFPHVGVLLHSGQTIRSLTIEDIWSKNAYRNSEYTLYDALNCFDLLLDIFQLCPLLQKITLRSPKDMVLSGELVYQHTELKSLHITQLEPNYHYKFLRHVSFCLPKLKKLHLQYNNNDRVDNRPTVIIVDIPNTSLDVFIWEYCFFYYKPMDTLPFSIKLKTKEDTKFYVFSNKRIVISDEKEYEDLLPNHLRIEIICEGLKEFRLVMPPFSHMF